MFVMTASATVWNSASGIPDVEINEGGVDMKTNDRWKGRLLAHLLHHAKNPFQGPVILASDSHSRHVASGITHECSVSYQTA